MVVGKELNLVTDFDENLQVVFLSIRIEISKPRQFGFSNFRFGARLD